MILILPPRWLITTVVNNADTAPTNSYVDYKTQEGIDYLFPCNISSDPVRCRINKVLESINEIGLSDTIYALSECENSHRELGCGDHGASCGFLMFQEPTWKAFNCEGSRFNLEDSVKCGVKLIRAGIGHESGGWLNCWRIKQLPIYEM